MKQVRISEFCLTSQIKRISIIGLYLCNHVKSGDILLLLHDVLFFFFKLHLKPL